MGDHGIGELISHNLQGLSPSMPEICYKNKHAYIGRWKISKF